MKVKLGLSDQDAEKGGELGGEGSQTGENFKICQCFEIIIAIFSTNYEMVEFSYVMSYGNQKAYHGKESLLFIA